MTEEEKRMILQERQYSVFKDNDLIQKTRYKLTAQEQKILLYSISKIKPNEELKPISLPLRQICQVCQVEESGKNYLNFRNTIQKLADKSFWIKKDKKYILLRWLNRVELDTATNIVTITFEKDLAPYLTFLNESYTSYMLEQVLCMKSKYSIRLYEILKSYSNICELTIKLNELKDILQVGEGYAVYNNFRVRVLDVAVSEINEMTDLLVDYATIRQGHKIDQIKFRIYEKDSIANFKLQWKRNSDLTK